MESVVRFTLRQRVLFNLIFVLMIVAGAFSIGLFITIALVGIVCAMLGRMLGDVGPWWQVLVGIVLIWVALGMLGVQACSMSGALLYRLNLRGIHGAFGLGLAYGIPSASSTFAFIAPILAIVTVQQKIVAGSVMMIGTRSMPRM